MIYQELVCEPGEHNGYESIRISNLENFLTPAQIKKIPQHKVTEDNGFWSDRTETTTAVYLSDAFPKIIENGFRYINTYWVPTTASESHKVLTFVK